MTMRTKYRLAFITAVTILATEVPSVHAGYSENFNSANPTDPLTTLAGWSYYNGSANTATIVSTGYNGTNGLSVPGSSAKYKRTLTGVEIGNAADGPLTFRIKIYVTDNPWAVPVVTLAEEGGVNGLSVAFNGGGDGSANLADNTIKISSGGTNWGANTNTTYTIPWKDKTWYEIIIHDIMLKTTGDGRNVTGKVDIVEAANPSSALLTDVDITGFGQLGGTFDKIDTIFVSASRVIYDDISLSAVPEPATLGFLGIGLLCTLASARRKH